MGANPWSKWEERQGLRRAHAQGRARPAPARGAPSLQASALNSLGPCSKHWAPAQPIDGRLQPLHRWPHGRPSHHPLSAALACTYSNASSCNAMWLQALWKRQRCCMQTHT